MIQILPRVHTKTLILKVLKFFFCSPPHVGHGQLCMECMEKLGLGLFGIVENAVICSYTKKADQNKTKWGCSELHFILIG